MARDARENRATVDGGRFQLIGDLLRRIFAPAADAPVGSDVMRLMLHLSRDQFPQHDRDHSLPGAGKARAKQEGATMDSGTKRGSGVTILIVLIAAVMLVFVALQTGFIQLGGDPGKLPDVAVEGGRAPNIDINVGSVDVGTQSTRVTVPTVTVGTTQEKVAVPVVDVKPADGN